MQHAFICASNSSNEPRKAKSTSGAFISVGKSLNFRFVLLRLAEDALTSLGSFNNSKSVLLPFNSLLPDSKMTACYAGPLICRYIVTALTKI